MAKTLNDILKGVNKSKEVPNDLTDLAMSPEGNKGEIEFAKKHKIQKHEDRVGNGDEIYTASKTKTTKYQKQDAKVYEAAECNRSGKGVHCEMHGEDDCSSSEPKDMPKKGQKVLMDKKVKEEVEDLEEMPSQYRTNFGMGAKRGWASSKASKVTFQNPHPLPRQGASKASLRDIAKQAAASSKITKVPAGKAKGIKEEEEIQEVAPPNPKIEKWIKANKERFVKEYGPEKGKQVLYAKAWKMHGQSESGSATNTDYTGPGAAGLTTGRLDVGTL